MGANVSQMEKINEKLVQNGWPRFETLWTDTQNSPYLAGLTGLTMGVTGMLSRSLILAGTAIGFGFSTYTIKHDIEFGASSNVAWTIVYGITSARNIKRLPLTMLVGLNAFYYGREMLDL